VNRGETEGNNFPFVIFHFSFFIENKTAKPQRKAEYAKLSEDMISIQDYSDHVAQLF
jgi:hypothetical protein